MNPSTVAYTTKSGAVLITDDGQDVFVHINDLRNALLWIRNDANASGSASVKGFTFYEDQATDLIDRIERKAHELPRRSA